MIFGINTTSDISKLLFVISRAIRRVKFETHVEKLVCTEKDVTRRPEALTGVSRASVLLQSWTKFVPTVMQYKLLTGNRQMTCQIRADAFLAVLQRNVRRQKTLR